MQYSSKQEPLQVTFHDPVTDSMVRLQGSLKFESLEERFPSTVPGVKSTLPHPERIGPYVIEAELGRGGMGVVYKAFDTRQHQPVALKVILRADYSEQKEMHRFQVEVTAAAKLRHPNIVQVFDMGTEKDVPYMALEFIEQGTLHRKTQGKPQEPRYAAYLVAGAADGIQHAHDHGILHRDLKPANILLRRDGDLPTSDGVNSVKSPFTEVPVISDFGLAKELDSSAINTQSGMAVGTPNYMSPEQASGMKQQIGKAADIYGLGAILYELLTGRPPFQGVNPVETMLLVMHLEAVPPRQLQPKVPVDLETICLKCLNKEPKKRYATAAEVAADLRRFLNGQVILARPAGQGERFVRWCRRHSAIAILLGIVLLLLISWASFATWFAIDANQRSMQLKEEKERAIRDLQQAQTK
jgi:serine/threonine protein kinase